MSDEIRPFPPYAPEPEHQADVISSGSSGGSKARRAGAVAAGVALALGAGGVAYAAGTSGSSDTPTAHPGYGVPGAGPEGGAAGGPGGFRGGPGREGFAGLGGGVLHGQATVRSGGPESTTTKEVFVQRGAITAVSATSLTVKSTDGFSKTYVLNADTKVRTPDALANGDTVGVTADVTGTTATATVVVEQGAKPAAGTTPKGGRGMRPRGPEGAVPSAPATPPSGSPEAPAAPSSARGQGSST